MRFLPSNPRRTAAEILLTVAIIAFVVYDLGDHSAKPEATNVALSFESKSKPSVSAPSRFETTITGIPAGSIFHVCGNTASPTNPWLIGNSTAGNQALSINLGGSLNGLTCSPLPLIYFLTASTNVTAPAGIIVATGSWLSFTDVTYPGSAGGATSGPLVMQPGSYLETIISPNVHLNPFGNVQYSLLTSQGSCPNFATVNFVQPISGCPVDLTLAMVGAYSCQVGYVASTNNGANYCNLYLQINGPLALQGSPVTFQFNQDCITFTQYQFKAAVFSTTGVPIAAVEVVTWGCGSIVTTFVVLGSSPALIQAATLAILAAAAPGGALYIALGGIIILYSPTITPAYQSYSYYAVPYCNYYYCTTTAFNPSSSNPGLFALLTLLIIPVAIMIGLLIWCCLPRAPVCEPMPVCPPAPVCPAAAPVMYYAEPYAMPCADPGAVYSTPSPTPAVMSLEATPIM